MAPGVDRIAVNGDSVAMFESQQYGFHGNWHDPNMCWEQMERKFKVSLLAAAAPSLYNPAWLQLHKPSNLEVEAAVAFLFGKWSGSRVEVSSKQGYANLLISHVRNQIVSPVAGKTRLDVFTIGINILKNKHLQRIMSLPRDVSHPGPMACLADKCNAAKGHPVLNGTPVPHAAAPSWNGPIVVARPGQRALLVQGSKMRELRRKHSGGAGNWTVEAGYVHCDEEGLSISVADCLADQQTPWPARPKLTQGSLTEHVTLHQQNLHLEMTTSKAHDAMWEKLQQEMAARKLHDTMLEKLQQEIAARQACKTTLQMVQVTRELDQMLISTEEEVTRLEAQVAEGGLAHSIIEAKLG